ncbi:hypothetical protein CEXT_507341 [Caerostris extrusa]|uniref:Uncharacterized protein n=1 Tax=Caerostris extrusa TaxID=172846 RepID=A0AAV4M8Q5_CAEEX|nr:hypothetical protein CEXT_507341 [Caerostris extrusa]
MAIFRIILFGDAKQKKKIQIFMLPPPTLCCKGYLRGRMGGSAEYCEWAKAHHHFNLIRFLKQHSNIHSGIPQKCLQRLSGDFIGRWGCEPSE